MTVKEVIRMLKKEGGLNLDRAALIDSFGIKHVQA